MRLLPLAILLLSLPAAAQAGQSSSRQILGTLTAGERAVGYRVLDLRDASRPSGPKLTPAGDPVKDRARRIAVHLWYPAEAGGGEPMTLGAYAGQAAADHRAFLARLYPPALTDAEWTTYSSAPMLARRDAPPAKGAHPLLVGSYRPMSLTLTAEYLASHGYVVALAQGPPDAILADGAVFEALQMSQIIRDMEVAVAAVREQPFVDPVKLGTLGFSGSGLSQLPYAMRSTDVDAAAQLDTGFYGPAGSSYRALPAYDSNALRTPFFYAYGASTLGSPDLHQAELNRLRYADRVVVFAGEPRLHHWDFATEGPAYLTLLNRRPEAKRGALRVSAAVHRHLLTFFDAYVRRDAAARAALARPSIEPGPGAMIELQFMPATVPAMSRRDFRRALDENPARAAELVREGLQRDPQAPVFEEEYLNNLGYELLNQRQGEKALVAFRLNVDTHPGSANALDSLSEALELIGNLPEAIQWAEKALAALPNDKSVPAAQRKQIEDSLRARIAKGKR